MAIAKVKVLVFVFAICILSIAPTAHAARIAPLVNYENIEIAGQPGKIISLDDIGKALVVAAQVNSWKISDAKTGQAMATLVIRNKHTIVVELTYTVKALSVKYKDSINMNYDPAYKEYNSNYNEVGSPTYDSANAKVYEVIHPNYNVWVGQLIKAIQAELMLMK
jgi:hypothetical protein